MSITYPAEELTTYRDYEPYEDSNGNQVYHADVIIKKTGCRIMRWSEFENFSDFMKQEMKEIYDLKILE